MTSSDKSNYPHLYHILEEAQHEMEQEKEEVDYQRETEKQRTTIKAGENVLLLDSGKFLPALENFLDLLGQRFHITRPGAKNSPQISDSSPYLSAQYSTNPELQKASAPPSEHSEYSEHSEHSEHSEYSEPSEYDDYDLSSFPDSSLHKEKMANRETRQTRKAQKSRENADLKGIHNELKRTQEELSYLRNQRSSPSVVVVPSSHAPAPAPVIINNNNNNNNSNQSSSQDLASLSKIGFLGTAYGMKDKNIIKEAQEEKKREREEKEKKELEKKQQDETLTRILAGLVALGLGAWGVYELARDSGKEVSNEELDLAAKNAREMLDTLIAVNSVLRLSELYQKLDRCVSIWQSYRKRICKHQDSLGFYKKMVWIPLALSGTTRAFLPEIWQGDSGEMLTLGIGLAFGYGALYWIYESTYYYFAYSKKDEWEKSEMSKLVEHIDPNSIGTSIQRNKREI